MLRNNIFTRLEPALINWLTDFLRTSPERITLRIPTENERAVEEYGRHVLEWPDGGMYIAQDIFQVLEALQMDGIAQFIETIAADPDTHKVLVAIHALSNSQPGFGQG